MRHSAVSTLLPKLDVAPETEVDTLLKPFVLLHGVYAGSEKLSNCEQI
jgi:hypothetical protein